MPKLPRGPPVFHHVFSCCAINTTDISMSNFYTSTVYNKGQEICRMYEMFLGIDGFRKGMDLYIERHDGQAVTCDDFRVAMADANGIADGLAQFETWYLQSGTPTIKSELTCAYDPSDSFSCRATRPQNCLNCAASLHVSAAQLTLWVILPQMMRNQGRRRYTWLRVVSPPQASR